jgi:predicted nuclease of restriction endonuclease-like (RecB) superfamily
MKKKSKLIVRGNLVLADYEKFLKSLKQKITAARVHAATAASRVLLALYWNIGREIVYKQEHSGWGDAVIEKLSADIRKTFPDMEGYSERNLWRMRAFYRAYEEKLPQSVAEAFEFLPQAVAEIPWGHHSLLIEKVKDGKARMWYAHKALEHGWSRDILWHNIDTKLMARQGKALTNFGRVLPQPGSDLAQQVLKDPYMFNFLSSEKEYRERELEQALIDNVEQFLLELGSGFCLVGRQVHLKVGNNDYYVDLLFYHLKLKCFVIVELKAGAFKPEYAGKINFYLSAVDSQMKQPDDNPSIGIILCKNKEAIDVEYALRNIGTPIGVAGWETKIIKKLPKDLQSSLPSVKEIETELLRNSKEIKGKK